MKDSNELKIPNKYLDKEDPEEINILLKFLAIIVEKFHSLGKYDNINLAKDFLDNKITPDNFSYSFMAIYGGIDQKIEELLESVSFVNKTDRCELNRLLARIYGSCDSFSPDPEIAMSDEKELKNCVQILLVKLQKE